MRILRERDAKSLRARLMLRKFDILGHLNLADILFSSGDYLGTIIILQKCLKKGYESGALYMTLARSYMFKWSIDGRINLSGKWRSRVIFRQEKQINYAFDYAFRS